MALTATIFKAVLQIADLERGYYADHALTLARHPSETDERLMVRLLAFALHATDDLQFTRGLCADDEPALWRRGPGEEIELWLDVGLPEERRLRKACHRARQAVLYAYGGRTAAQWWERNGPELRRLDNLQVFHLPQEATRALAGLAERSMQLQCTVQEGQVWLGSAADTVLIEPQRWL